MNKVKRQQRASWLSACTALVLGLPDTSIHVAGLFFLVLLRHIPFLRKESVPSSLQKPESYTWIRQESTFFNPMFVGQGRCNLFVWKPEMCNRSTNIEQSAPAHFLLLSSPRSFDFLVTFSFRLFNFSNPHTAFNGLPATAEKVKTSHSRFCSLFKIPIRSFIFKFGL